MIAKTLSTATLLTTVLCFATITHAQRMVNPPVVLGSVEPDYKFPWVVNVAGGLNCHGTLIARHWVLTAAHCVQTTPFSTWVQYSRTSPTGVVTSGGEFDGTRAIVHPEYDPHTLAHDIALVSLRTPLDDGPSGPDPLLRPADLPTAPPAAGLAGVIASTIHHTDGPLPPGTVAVLQGTVFDPRGIAFSMTSSTAALCPGDSGSGFVTSASNKTVVHGVASSIPTYGLTCDAPDVPANLTSVYGHLDWIAQVTRLAGEIQGTGDFDADGQRDILLRNSNGTVAIWFMDHGTITSQSLVGAAAGSEWSVQGTGDFNADGRADILWRHSSGSVAIWFMRGAVVQTISYLSVAPGNDWKIQGTGDFNADGRTDILWRHAGGTVGIWFMRGGVIDAQAFPPVVPGSDWQIQGTGDFNVDGRSDIVWRNVDGTVAIWFMRGGVIDAQAYPSTVPASWHIHGIGDFNADGRSDLLWRHDDGTVAIWFMRGGVIEAQAYPAVVSNDWQIQSAGDFNADNRSDILWRDSDGTVAIWFMKGGVIQSQAYPFSR